MRVRWMLGVLVTAAVMALGASEARAQEACAVPEDVAPPVYQSYVDLLGPGFPMAEAACVKLAKGALSACHKTVSAATRCWKGVGKGLAKGAKTTCKEQGDEQGDCLDATAAWLAGLQGEVAASEAAGHAACDAGAVSLLFDCLGL